MRVSRFIFLFLLAFTTSAMWQVQNRHFLMEDSPSTLREGITVQTADDASYLAPVENFLQRGEWRSNAVGDAAISTRSPGYGLVFLCFRSWLSIENALIALVVFQILLFAMAVSLLPDLVHLLGASRSMGIFIAVIAAVMPTFSGFLGYTLTEGVTPSLVLLFLYALLRFRQKQKGLLPAILLLGVLILVRPVMGIWILAPLIAAVSTRGAMRKRFILLALASLIPLTVWMGYTWRMTGKWQGLHPIYHQDAPGLFRPLHGAVWDFHKMWGQEGAEFHRAMASLWSAAQGDIDTGKAVEDVLGSMDPRAVKAAGYENLRRAYGDYVSVLRSQVPYERSETPIPKNFNPLEQDLSAQFDGFRNEYVREYPIHALAVVPMGVYFRLAAHSNLSMYMFQKPLRGAWWMEGLRWFSFILHFGTFVLFPIGLIVLSRPGNSMLMLAKSLRTRSDAADKRNGESHDLEERPKTPNGENRSHTTRRRPHGPNGRSPQSTQNTGRIPWKMVAWPIAVYLLYLIFVQRGVEERYTLPVLIPMFIVASVFASRIQRKLRNLSL